MTALSDKILTHVVVQDDGCWMWTRSRTTSGYGQMSLHDRVIGKRVTRTVHKLLYEELVGPVPEGLQLDHTCHNADASCPGGTTCPHRACVNPTHLEPVTNQVNTQRGRKAESARALAALLTHCINGHPFAGPNLRVDEDGSRHCRACERRKTRRHSGIGVRGPRVRVLSRQGLTLTLACGHTKRLKHYNRPYAFALCPACEAELNGSRL